jgi:hypothetical protein
LPGYLYVKLGDDVEMENDKHVKEFTPENSRKTKNNLQDLDIVLDERAINFFLTENDPFYFSKVKIVFFEKRG